MKKIKTLKQIMESVYDDNIFLKPPQRDHYVYFDDGGMIRYITLTVDMVNAFKNSHYGVYLDKFKNMPQVYLMLNYKKQKLTQVYLFQFQPSHGYSFHQFKQFDLFSLREIVQKPIYITRIETPDSIKEFLKDSGQLAVTFTQEEYKKIHGLL